MSMRQIVIFKLGNEEYGIDITKVVEIVLHQEVRHVPDAPNHIEGIVNLRGDIHPIYSLTKRFNMEQRVADEDTKIIIMRTTARNVGFIVDYVSEIIDISEEDIQGVPNIVNTNSKDQYIEGIAKKDNRIIVLLDIDSLVTDKDYVAMDKITKSE